MGSGVRLGQSLRPTLEWYSLDLIFHLEIEDNMKIYSTELFQGLNELFLIKICIQ